MSNVLSYAVAPDLWGDAYVGGFYKVEVGKGGDFWNNPYVGHLLS